MDKVKKHDCIYKKKKRGKVTLADWFWEAGFHGITQISGVRFIQTPKKKQIKEMGWLK